MPGMSRSKGRRGELEARRIITGVLPPDWDVRTTRQEQAGKRANGGDLVIYRPGADLPEPITIEVKLGESVQVPAAYRQAQEEAPKASHLIVVLHRDSSRSVRDQPWLATASDLDWCRLGIEVPGAFCRHQRHRGTGPCCASVCRWNQIGGWESVPEGLPLARCPEYVRSYALPDLYRADGRPAAQRRSQSHPEWCGAIWGNDCLHWTKIRGGEALGTMLASRAAPAIAEVLG